MPTAALVSMNDGGITATATPLPAERLLSLRPQQPDAPMKVIGPLVGHERFELWFWGWGVGACPHEWGLLADRRAACRPPGELASQDDL